MNIKKLIKECHENAVNKGFYPEGEEKNVAEIIMLTMCEIAEAVEAHRKGKFADVEMLVYLTDGVKEKRSFNNAFECKVKNTFEDEIADVFIRLFDLAGYLKVDILEIENSDHTIYDNVAENLFVIGDHLYDLWLLKDFDSCTEILSAMVNDLQFFCSHHKIDIDKHIKLKMKYNAGRPHKHGKRY